MIMRNRNVIFICYQKFYTIWNFGKWEFALRVGVHGLKISDLIISL